ncbi:MAG: hypothetical protein AAGH76_00250 [Pseudomonadota bacterium]
MTVALAGVRDMRPALTRAMNNDPTDDRLDLVFGSQPRRRIVALVLLAVMAGELFLALTPEFELKWELNWSAIVVVVGYALALRRYLFRSGNARVDDFPWLAGSIIPAAVALTVVAFVRSAVNGGLAPDPGAPWITVIGKLLFAVTSAYGVAAVITIALAAVCFSRRWWVAVRDLAMNLFVFKILLWITVLVLIDIGIVGRILAAILDATLGIRFPGWLADFADMLSYSVLLATVYTAVIGATWVVCRQQFPTLLTEGDVNVVAAVRDMAKQPSKKKQKKADKKPRKRRWFRRKQQAGEAD